MKVPHAWSGSHWTCIHCGETHPDPCACRCCGISQYTSDPETAGLLRELGDSLREKYGTFSEQLVTPIPRRVKPPRD